MILQELNHLYDRLKDDPAYLIAPEGFSVQKISFKIVLKPNGELFEIQDARHPRGKRLVPTQVLVLGDAKPSGQGINPCFLWDNAKYLLGYTDSEDSERTAQCFAASRQKHQEIGELIKSRGLGAVCRFLADWDPSQAQDHAVLTELGTGFGVFQIQGEQSYVHEDQAVHQWWVSRRQNPEESAYTCLVSGNKEPIAKTHNKVKGVIGGQSSGAAIVSFNERAYESYGAQQSFNAPVGKTAAFRYVTALNALLDGPMQDKHKIRMGDTTVAFWTERPTAAEDVMALFLGGAPAQKPDSPAQDEELRAKLAAYLETLRKGRADEFGLNNPEIATKFNLVGLAPNAARVSLRFHLRGSLGELLEHQRLHFEQMGIESDGKASGPMSDFPSLRALLDEACPWIGGKPDRDRLPPIHTGPLLRAVLGGTRYPDGFFNAVLGRIRAERTVRRTRAGFIKAYLIRNRGQEVTMSLDVNNTEKAYLLGRLFSAFEKTQADALGNNINATIRDRFYGAASATPRTVFPRLLRTYQHHLGKLSAGMRVNREKLIQEIMAPLAPPEGFPAHLNLADQGLFAIGYYHQTRAFYTKARDHENIERNEA